MLSLSGVTGFNQPPTPPLVKIEFFIHLVLGLKTLYTTWGWGFVVIF